MLPVVRLSVLLVVVLACLLMPTWAIFPFESLAVGWQCLEQ
jgi:hypothetical protein